MQGESEFKWVYKELTAYVFKGTIAGMQNLQILGMAFFGWSRRCTVKLQVIKGVRPIVIKVYLDYYLRRLPVNLITTISQAAMHLSDILGQGFSTFF